MTESTVFQANVLDRYPSRVSDKPSVMRRLDPVVYGKETDGPLSNSQLAQYVDDGFLHLEGLFDGDQLAQWVTELDRLRGDPSVCSSSQAIVEPESKELRSIFSVHRISDVMGALVRHPMIAGVARQLLGSDVYVHQSRINYKGGFRGTEFYWHSDFETWHVEDGLPAMRAVSCSISLTPNTPWNGPLMLIPGSHQRFVSCVGQTPDNHFESSLRRQELGTPDDDSLIKLVDDFGIVAPTGPAGSVTFFECNTMHGSNSNITPMPRSNIFIVYNSVHNRPVKPFCGLAPRPNFIAERQDFSPV